MVIPTLAGYPEALPDGADSEVDVRVDEAEYDYSVADGNFDAQKAARPAARRLQGTHGGLSFEVGKKSAVADIVYDWLGRDMHRLGVVDGLDGGSSNSTTTVWASRPPNWQDLFPE
jgi:hypothetical protein